MSQRSLFPFLVLVFAFVSGCPTVSAQEEKSPKKVEKEEKEESADVESLKNELERLRKRVEGLEKSKKDGDIDAKKADKDPKANDKDPKANDKDPKANEKDSKKAAAAKQDPFNKYSGEPGNTVETGPAETTLQSIFLKNAKKLKIYGQARVRGEIKDNNTDIDSSLSDRDEFALLRVRLGFQFTVREDLTVVAEFQDSRQFGGESTPASTGRELESTDISLGFIEAHDLLVDGLNVRLGRQILNFGDERLVGAFEYNNFANRFDALSVIYRISDKKYDVIPTDTSADKLRIHSFLAIVDETNLNNDDAVFGGVYVTVDDWIPAGLMEAYYFLLNDSDNRAFTGENGRTGNLTVHTVGTRGKFWIEPFIVIFEGAYQFGEFADDDIKAYAVSANLIYKAFKLPWQPRFALTYNYASGDDDPTDGDRKTFNNLFPTNHLFYGVTDFLLAELRKYAVSGSILSH
ncbi:MAG: alginate export family protein [Planctomycetota bacterium]|nr:alginate export family protein [Planctomycetota bacterium]